MNYGLYLAASGVLTNMHRQDVTANNLANTSTAGFKRGLAALSQRSTEVVEDHLDPNLSHQLLEKLGGGVLAGPNRIDFSPGSIVPNGGELDIAISGEGFFAVRDDSDAQAPLKLTRDGRFTLSRDGHLVTMVGGKNVLDAGDGPITLRRDLQVKIDAEGNIVQGGAAVARLKVLTVPAADTLRATGGGLLAPTAQQMQAAKPARGTLVQGAVEQSNVDPVREMLSMLESTRAINFNAQLIQYHDAAMDRAVNQFGRVA